jgi:(R,R)-butanediol dehydrogenase/meso-butanediol dehydrogenase/diacetyl reductase
MKVLNIHEVGDVRLDDYVLPEAGPKDVVVKMKAVGICGSDLSYIKMGGIMRQPGGVTPIGHEGAGEVLRVGSAVSGISPMNTPSNVGSGGPEGAFVNELLVREARLGDSILPIPAGVSYDVAAMCEPLAVALHGVNRANLKPGDKAVVFGCGPIGLGMILWLVERGITDVIAFDLAPERLERALALGARAAFDPTKVNLYETLGELHGKEMCMHKPAVGTDAFLDAAGAPSIPTDVINVCKYRSRLVVTAVYYKPVEIPLGTMLTSELEITTAVGYPTEMPEVVAAMPRLKDKIASMISHRIAFEDVIEGLKIAATPQSAKVMVHFDSAST